MNYGALPADMEMLPLSRSPIRLADSTLRAALAADPVGAPGPNLNASVVIVTFNNLPLTRLCLASLLAGSPRPAEVIIIDNASTDGTREFLTTLAASQPTVRT